ncbi:uncharacterized protein LOC135105495 [Scylla paramamosain]|uniref:uncharacterized protein LOC135105495 n=1 Tax=Scylla paramamosain TaxID=85552 RepID=UPI0030836E0C
MGRPEEDRQPSRSSGKVVVAVAAAAGRRRAYMCQMLTDKRYREEHRCRGSVKHHEHTFLCSLAGGCRLGISNRNYRFTHTLNTRSGISGQQGSYHRKIVNLWTASLG